MNYCMEHNKETYTFTIIIPTYNRKQYLLDTLQFVFQQTIKPLEIIVVDASEPAFQLSYSDLETFNSLVKYIPWDEYGNISKQRNYAIEIAQGDYILFLDDDVVFSDSLIDDYITAFKQTNADGISGLVETEKYRFGHAPLKFPGILSDVGESNLQPCNFIAPTKIICTASFAIKTSALKAINGFDEFQRGSYDDMEAGFRLVNQGYFIIHHPLPKVFHIQAKASGARDVSHGNSWALENQIYFLLKHRYSNNKKKFLLLLVTEILKPSRAWLSPLKILTKLKMAIAGFIRYAEIEKKLNVQQTQ